SRRRHTRCLSDWSSDVCSSDLAGHDPATGRVTLMLHTFVGDDDDNVRELVRRPMKEYLRSSIKLMLDFAWSFAAFKRPGGGAERSEERRVGKEGGAGGVAGGEK